jgi:hypothetical protein
MKSPQRSRNVRSDQEIEKIVLPKYKRLNPGWTNTRVTEIIPDVFGGTLVVVRGQPPQIIENEEICYVSPEGGATIFSTTEELARFLEEKAQEPWLERLFYRPHIAGAVFVLLLVGIFVAGFHHPKDFSPQALATLGSVVGLAAGFFFGSARRAA